MRRNFGVIGHRRCGNLRYFADYQSKPERAKCLKMLKKKRIAGF